MQGSPYILWGPISIICKCSEHNKMCMPGRSSIQLKCARTRCSEQLHYIGLLYEVSTKWATAVANTMQFMGHVVVSFEYKNDNAACRLVLGELAGPHAVSIMNNYISHIYL